MRNIVYSKMPSDFLVQGLGLHPDGQSGYFGKIGRHEVALFFAFEPLNLTQEDSQVLALGLVPGGKFRSGDVLMAGSDELLDRTFQALDDMEQRGVVVNFEQAEDPSQIYVEKAPWQTEVQVWKEKKVPYICLLMVDPVTNDDQSKMLTLLRKIIN